MIGTGLLSGLRRRSGLNRLPPLPGPPGTRVDLGGSEPSPRWSARLVAFMLVVALVGGTLFIRLAQLQVTDAALLAQEAQANRFHRVVLEADRGIVYDRHGAQLVVNRPAWTLRVVPAGLVREPLARALELRRLARLSGRGEGDLRQALAQAPDPHAAVTLKDDLTPEQAQAVQEQVPELPGVDLEQRPLRTYLDASVFEPVLGYTGRLNADDYARLKARGYQPDESLGKAGVEAGLESLLRGRDGWATVETDASGKIVRTLHEQPAAAGLGVYLSLDAGLQREVARDLAAGVAAAHSQAGAALVVDPTTGEVLAMSSAPGFDSNLFAGGISGTDYQKLLNDPARPLFNRAIAGQYPPGSTFKMVTAAAGLEEGKIGTGSYLPCPAAIRYGGWTYRNWAGYDMGSMNVVKAIAVSCDTFFYAVADRVGDQALARYARAFGYGKPPPIEMPGAAGGLVPDSDWKATSCSSRDAADCRWNPGETLTMGIGQSYLLTTPLIQAMYVSAVANGGTLLSPTLVHQVRDGAGRTVSGQPPEVVSQVPVSAANLDAVRQGMRDCLQAPYGTGYQFRADHFAHGGGCKTGTAQYGGSGTDLPTHAWFTFFSPYDHPEIAVVVVVEGGGEGDVAAEPVAVRIADYYYAHRDAIRG